MSFADSPASSSSGTPDCSAPMKFNVDLLEDQKAGKPSTTALSAHVAIEMNTPDTGNEENVQSRFQFPLMDTANDAASLPSMIPNPIDMLSSDEFTLKLLRDEAEKRILSQLSGNEGREDTASKRGVARKRRALLPFSPLAQSLHRAQYSNGLNGISKMHDDQDVATAMLCDRMSQETESSDQGSSSNRSPIYHSCHFAVKGQNACLPGASSMMDSLFEQDMSLARHSIYSTLNGKSFKCNQENASAMVFNGISQDGSGEITGTWSCNQGSPHSSIEDSCHFAVEEQSESLPGPSSRMESPLKQDAWTAQCPISTDNIHRPCYSTLRGDSFGYDIPVYPPMVSSAITASSDDYAKWITNYRTKRMAAMSKQAKPIDYDGEALEEAFLAENSTEFEDLSEPLSPVFDVDKSEVEYWQDQVKLGRHFCDFSEMMNGYVNGKGALTKGKQTDKSCSTALAVKHADTFTDRNEFGSMPDAGSEDLSSPHLQSVGINNSATSTNRVMEFGQLTEGNRTQKGSADALESSQISSAVEKRAKRAHRSSPVYEAMEIEKKKLAAKIARKMEPEFVYDSGRLAMEAFEASVEVVEAEENEDGDMQMVKIDFDRLDREEQNLEHQ